MACCFCSHPAQQRRLAFLLVVLKHLCDCTSSLQLQHLRIPEPPTQGSRSLHGADLCWSWQPHVQSRIGQKLASSRPHFEATGATLCTGQKFWSETPTWRAMKPVAFQENNCHIPRNDMINKRCGQRAAMLWQTAIVLMFQSSILSMDKRQLKTTVSGSQQYSQLVLQRQSCRPWGHAWKVCVCVKFEGRRCGKNMVNTETLIEPVVPCRSNSADAQSRSRSRQWGKLAQPPARSGGNIVSVLYMLAGPSCRDS